MAATAKIIPMGKDAAPMDDLADSIFDTFKAYADKKIAKATAELEARVRLLELIDERRTRTVTHHERDNHGEIVRSIAEREE